MKNTFGNSISITLFGESHGEAIGAVLDGLPAGINIDFDSVDRFLGLRRPSGLISTPRKEKDNYKILSGVFEGKTTGTPICIMIPNENTHSKDYSATYGKARPGHADYTAFIKYKGCEDYRGGGHFSGRVTAPIVAAGGIVAGILKEKGMEIGTHISKCAGISDIDFNDFSEDIKALSNLAFPVLDAQKGKEMENAILSASQKGNSVGGVLETVVTGLPAGLGEPWFDSMESLLSHGLFSIPAVKGVEFGRGFGCADLLGSEMNDSFYYDGNTVKTKTNNNGGINGGITNGMPVIFRCAVKPTPSISTEQETVDFIKGENTKLKTTGRHDPCIVHRARIVVDSITALVTADLLTQKYGTDWLSE